MCNSESITGCTAINVLYGTTVEISKLKHITICYTSYSTNELLPSKVGTFHNLCTQVSRTKMLLYPVALMVATLSGCIPTGVGG